MVSLVDAKEKILAGLLQLVDTGRRHPRERGSRGKTLPHFTVGDCVLVARVSIQLEHRKLMNTWTRPSCVANDDKLHVYAVHHLVTAEPSDVHVARMRFYANDHLEITGELLKVFQLLENQDWYHMWSSSATKRAATGDEFDVKVAWERLEETGSTSGPVPRAFHGAPTVLRKNLKALRLKAEQTRALVQRYRLRL